MTASKTAPARPAQVWRGAVLILIAVFIFACMDTVGKYLMTRFNVPLVATARYGVNLLLLLAIAVARRDTAAWKTHHTRLVVLRGISLAFSSLFAGLALRHMPVGETVAILYLAPIIVVVLAGRFLNESVGFFAWLAAAAGFVGVLLIARPGSGLSTLGVSFALAGAATSVIYVILSRQLAATESTMAMLFHAGLAGLVLFGTMMPWYWTGPTFTLLDYVLLTFMGASSLLGHFLFTSAYREAPASLLAPVNYFHIGWAVLLGWVFFGHIPDLFTIAGMGMITLAGVAVAITTHYVKKTAKKI
jgi:drug/metabolite transporter (DMT)-like permease